MTYATRDLDEALRSPREPISWLVEDLVPADGLSVWAGAAKSGKSLLACALALAVSSGEPHLWLGRRVKRARVLLVEMEGSPSSLLDRFARIAKERDLPVAPNDVRFTIRPDLTLPENLARLRETADEIEAGLVIIDPLYLIAGDRDENSSASMVPVLASLVDLAERRAVLLIHHTGKPAAERGSTRDAFASIRGSSSIFAAASAAAILETTSEDGLLARLNIRCRDSRRSIIDLERGADALLWRSAPRGVAA